MSEKNDKDVDCLGLKQMNVAKYNNDATLVGFLGCIKEQIPTQL